MAAPLMLHAGLDGIEQELDPGTPFNNDLYRFNREEQKNAAFTRCRRRCCTRSKPSKPTRW